MIVLRKDEGRLVGHGARFVERLAHLVGVHAVDGDGVPARGFEAGGDIFGEREIGGAGQGDVVLVVEIDQLAETEMPGDGGGFHGDAFHDVTIGDDGVGVVVDHLVAGAVVGGGQEMLGDGHADGVAEPLPQRSGGDFDAGSKPVFRVARRDRAELAERLESVRAGDRSR